MKVYAVDKDNLVRVKSPPPAVGGWVLPGSIPGSEVRFNMPARPRWHVRVMMKLVFGWQWRDK